MSARRLAVAAGLAVVFATPAHAGPPWISIECPANPHHQLTRGATFLVRTYHHFQAVPATLTGTAEGLVRGQRRSVALQFAQGPGDGVYLVTSELPRDGAWILVIRNNIGTEGATAVVELADGRVAGVEVPHRTTSDGWKVPRQVTDAEIEAALRKHATKLASAERRGSPLGAMLLAAGLLLAWPVAARFRR